MEYTKKDLLEGKLLNEDGWENALMVAGFIPVIGEIADIILIIRYLMKGEYLYAAIMLIALVPMVGDIIAKPFIKVLKGAGGAGKVALRSADDMAEYLMKNPSLRNQYTNMAKHFDDPAVKKTIEGVSKVNSSWGRQMSRSIDEAKSVVGKLRPVQMARRAGQEVVAGGKLSRGMKAFFQEEKLAQYIAKTGSKPTTWLSNWWNVVRAGRKARKDMFRSVLMSSNVLHALGLPSLKSDNDIERLLRDPEYANAIANDPQLSNYIANNTSQEEMSGDTGVGAGDIVGTMMSLSTLKYLAKALV